MCLKFFDGKIYFIFQNCSSIIILLFLKAKLSIFAWGLIFVDKLPYNSWVKEGLIPIFECLGIDH